MLLLATHAAAVQQAEEAAENPTQDPKVNVTDKCHKAGSTTRYVKKQEINTKATLQVHDHALYQKIYQYSHAEFSRITSEQDDLAMMWNMANPDCSLSRSPDQAVVRVDDSPTFAMDQQSQATRARTDNKTINEAI